MSELNNTANDFSSVEYAAQLIAQDDALIVAAGAGMGVDSGLPDFRGKDGFWRASAGGITDLSFRGIPIELKVES